MVCTCCGQWRVTQVVLDDGRRGPLQRLRLTHCGYHVGDYPDPAALEAVLAEANVLHHMTIG